IPEELRQYFQERREEFRERREEERRDEVREIMFRLHRACDEGDRRACIQFGMIIGENREHRAQWRREHPELFGWERRLLAEDNNGGANDEENLCSSHRCTDRAWFARMAWAIMTKGERYKEPIALAA